MLLERTSDPTPAAVETAVGPVAIACEGDPARPAVLCVHGIPGSGRDFRYLAPRLSERLFVVRIDMPGFGASPVNTVDSVTGWADTIRAVADSLDLERFGVVAHSFGGSAALNVTHRFARRVRGLALLASPGGRMHRGYGSHPALFRAIAELSGLPLARVPTVALVRAQFARRGLRSPTDWQRVRNMLRVVASLRFQALARWASELTCPVVLAHAEDDPLVEIEIACEQAVRIADCEALFWLEGGHYIQKTHAAPIADAVLQRIFA